MVFSDRRGPRDDAPDTFSRAEFGTGARDAPPRSYVTFLFAVTQKYFHLPTAKMPNFQDVLYCYSSLTSNHVALCSDRRGPRDEAPDTFSRAEFGTGCKEAPREPRS